MNEIMMDEIIFEKRYIKLKNLQSEDLFNSDLD